MSTVGGSRAGSAAEAAAPGGVSAPAMAACADATASRTAGVGVFAVRVAVAGTGLIPFASVCFLNAAANPGTAAEAYGDRRDSDEARVVPARAVAGRTRPGWSAASVVSVVGCFVEDVKDASPAAEARSRTTSAAAFTEGFVFVIGGL
jgi:hypothetical protein